MTTKAKHTPTPSQELTDEQVENWRKVLCQTLGPYALIAPREQIQEIRDNMQNQALKDAGDQK